jgi:YHS domain-containing protein
MTKVYSYYNRDGIALKGFDVVAFHTLGKALKGQKDFTCNWFGVTWYFINEEHLRLFKEDPEKYAPQYGGYCAFGISRGYKAPTEMYTFTIYNERLFLNYSNYVKRRWLEQMKKHIEKSEDQWQEVSKQMPIKSDRRIFYLKYLFLKAIGRDPLR